jgi:hypothetical protein
MYQSLTQDLEEQHGISGATYWTRAADHDAHVEVIRTEDEDDNDGDATMPSLVYVSREKRRSSPHHFKAGALNVLVSADHLPLNSFHFKA